MTRRSYRRRVPRRTDLWPRAWRRRPLASLVLLVLVMLVAWDHLSTPLGSDHDRYHNKTFTCVRVVDGDTFDIDIPDGEHSTTRIRLWGVDTPEVAKSGRGEMHFGPEASAFTKTLIEGKPVRVVLDPHQTRGKYGRLLAYVYPVDGGEMLNEALIAGGYAYADTRFKHLWRPRFLSLEQRARKEKVGLWAGVRPDQMPEWRQRYEQWRSGQSD